MLFNRLIIVVFLAIATSTYLFVGKYKSKKFEIDWLKEMNEDFSFRDQYSYPEGVYKNQFGQLSCDGICPDGIDIMKDSNGKIIKDSISSFYQIVDTSHIYHSLASQTNVYEWLSADYMVFNQSSNGIIVGESETNVATHSSLFIKLEDNHFDAWIEFISFTNIEKQIFPLKKGTLKLEKEGFDKGIVKGFFDFKFTNTLDPDLEIYWIGKIYSKVNDVESSN